MRHAHSGTDGPTLPPGIRVLPRRALSQAAGTVARAPWPRFVLRPAMWLYARVFRVDLEEAEHGLGGYPSFLDFFTRRLRDGLRPLPSDPDAVVSPSDGRVHATGRIEDGSLLQAKGVDYALADLLGSTEAAHALDGGTHLTIHLAPGDYHRFHWPFDAHVEEVIHIAGDLWPVHARAAAALPGLFTANERVVIRGRTRNEGAFAVVAIGALNVGSIRLAFHPVRTNRGGSARMRTWHVDGPDAHRGEEMGLFELGSTLVVLLAPDAGCIDDLPPGTILRACQAVGNLCPLAAPS